MIRTLSLSLALFIASLTSVYAAGWEVDKAHSKVGFTVTHMVISTVDGRFREYTANVNFDEQNPASLSFDASIDAASVYTDNEKRDADLRSDKFFDVAKFPKITFKSTKTDVVGPGKFKVTGDLTIRDVTKSVALDLQGLDKFLDTPWGTRKAAVRATGEIDRQEFGLKWDAKLPGGDLVVADKVKLDLVIELDQKKE